MKRHFFFQNKSFLEGMAISLFAMLCICLPAHAVHDGILNYANESDIIWQMNTNMQIKPIQNANPNFPIMSDSSTWVKKDGYTIMYYLPIPNLKKSDDNYCMVYFEGKGIYKGFYRIGYAAQNELWYIFDIGCENGYAGLTAGELYNITLDEYIAANGNLNGVEKKTIWLGEEYTGEINLTDEKIISIFQENFGLQPNKKGTKMIQYSFLDDVHFPEVNIGRGIHHYDILGRPVYATVYQGDFTYYGECKAGVSVSGWEIEGNNISFHFDNPTILSTDFYIEPSRYNPMNFNDAALKTYKYQDNIALSKSNVDDQFKIDFNEKVQQWLKKLPYQAEADHAYEVVEARPNSILRKRVLQYNDYGRIVSWTVDFICKNSSDFCDPHYTYKKYCSEILAPDQNVNSPLREIFYGEKNAERCRNLHQLFKAASNVCVLNFDLATMELLVMVGNGDIYDCELAITKDATGDMRWNVVNVKKDDHTVSLIEQFNKENAKKYERFSSKKWHKEAIMTKPLKTFADIIETFQILPAMKEESAALSIYEETYENYREDKKSFDNAKDSLLYKFKDKKKLSTMLPGYRDFYGFEFKNIDDLTEEVVKFMEEVYIFHEYITKGKSADAKAWSQKLSKAKTREEIIAALDIKVPDMKKVVNERIKTMADTTSIKNIEWQKKYETRQQNEWFDFMVRYFTLKNFPEYK